MDNQHQKITGYRDLTQEEIDLMNRIKSKEAEVLALHAEVLERIHSQVVGGTASVEWQRVNDADAFRWSHIARDDIEKGFMAMVRAVAQPQPKSNKDK